MKQNSQNYSNNNQIQISFASIIQNETQNLLRDVSIESQNDNKKNRATSYINQRFSQFNIRSNEQIQEEEEDEEQNEESKTNLYSVQEEDSQESIQKIISPINKYSIQQSVEQFDKKISLNKKSVRLTSLENICDNESENQNKKQTTQSDVSENYIEQQQQDQQQQIILKNNMSSQHMINNYKDMLELNEYLVKDNIDSFGMIRFNNQKKKKKRNSLYLYNKLEQFYTQNSQTQLLEQLRQIKKKVKSLQNQQLPRQEVLWHKRQLSENYFNIYQEQLKDKLQIQQKRQKRSKSTKKSSAVYSNNQIQKIYVSLVQMANKFKKNQEGNINEAQKQDINKNMVMLENFSEQNLYSLGEIYSVNQNTLKNILQNNKNNLISYQQHNQIDMEFFDKQKDFKDSKQIKKIQFKIQNDSDLQDLLYQLDQYEHGYTIDIPQISHIPKYIINKLQSSQFISGEIQLKTRKKSSLILKKGNSFLGKIIENQNISSQLKSISWAQFERKKSINLDTYFEENTELEDNWEKNLNEIEILQLSQNLISPKNINQTKYEQNDNIKNKFQKIEQKTFQKKQQIYTQEDPNIIQELYNKQEWFGILPQQALHKLQKLQISQDFEYFLQSVQEQKVEWMQVFSSSEKTLFQLRNLKNNSAFVQFMRNTNIINQLIIMKIFRPDMLNLLGERAINKNFQIFSQITHSNTNQLIISNWIQKPTIIYNNKKGVNFSNIIANKALQIQAKTKFIYTCEDLNKFLFINNQDHQKQNLDQSYNVEEKNSIKIKNEKEIYFVILDTLQNWSDKEIISAFKMFEKKLRNQTLKQYKFWIIINYQQLIRNKQKQELIQQLSRNCWVIFQEQAQNIKQEYTDLLYLEMEDFLKNMQNNEKGGESQTNRQIGSSKNIINTFNRQSQKSILQQQQKSSQDLIIGENQNPIYYNQQSSIRDFGSATSIYAFGKFEIQDEIQNNLKRIFEKVNPENESINLNSFLNKNKLNQQRKIEKDFIDDYIMKLKYDTQLLFVFYKQRSQLLNREVLVSNSQFSEILDYVLLFLKTYRIQPKEFIYKYFKNFINSTDFNCIYDFFYEKDIAHQDQIIVEGNKYDLFQLNENQDILETLFNQVNQFPNKDSYTILSLSKNREIQNNYHKSVKFINDFQIASDIKQYEEESKIPNLELQSQKIEKNQKLEKLQIKKLKILQQNSQKKDFLIIFDLLSYFNDEFSEIVYDFSKLKKQENAEDYQINLQSVLDTWISQHPLQYSLQEFNQIDSIFQISQFKQQTDDKFLQKFTETKVIGSIQDDNVDGTILNLQLKLTTQMLEKRGGINVKQNIYNLNRGQNPWQMKAPKSESIQLPQYPRYNDFLFRRELTSQNLQTKLSKQVQYTLKKTKKFIELNIQNSPKVKQKTNNTIQQNLKTEQNEEILQKSYQKQLDQFFYYNEQNQSIEESEENQEFSYSSFSSLEQLLDEENSCEQINTQSQLLNQDLDDDENQIQFRKSNQNQKNTDQQQTTSDEKLNFQSQIHNNKKMSEPTFMNRLQYQQNRFSTAANTHKMSLATTQKLTPQIRDKLNNLKQIQLKSDYLIENQKNSYIRKQSLKFQLQNQGNKLLNKAKEIGSNLSLSQQVNKFNNSQIKVTNEIGMKTSIKYQIQKNNLERGDSFTSNNNDNNNKNNNNKNNDNINNNDSHDFVSKQIIDSSNMVSLNQSGYSSSQQDNDYDTEREIEIESQQVSDFDSEDTYNSPGQFQLFELLIKNEVSQFNNLLQKIKNDLQNMEKIIINTGLECLPIEFQNNYNDLIQGITPNSWLQEMNCEYSQQEHTQKVVFTDFILHFLQKYEFLNELIYQRNGKMFKILDLSKLFNPFQLIINQLWSASIEYQQPIYQLKVMLEFLDDQDIQQYQFDRHGIQACGMQMYEGVLNSNNQHLEDPKPREFYYKFQPFRIYVMPVTYLKKQIDPEIINFHLKNEINDNFLSNNSNQQKTQISANKLKQHKYQQRYTEFGGTRNNIQNLISQQIDQYQVYKVQIPIMNPIENQNNFRFKFQFQFKSLKPQSYWDRKETKIFISNTLN